MRFCGKECALGAKKTDLRMKGQTQETETASRRSRNRHKARMWGNRAAVAHGEGREADAARCEDKARDWESRAREIERRPKDQK